MGVHHLSNRTQRNFIKEMEKIQKEADSKERYLCPSCKTENMEHQKYCVNCGTWLLSTSFPATKVKKKPRKLTRYIRNFFVTVIGVFVLFGIIGALIQPKSEPASSEQSSQPAAESQEEYKAAAATIPFLDLARNPESFKSKSVTYTGKVIQTLESGNKVELRINVTKEQYGWQDTVYVNFRKAQGEDRILENDIITLWGDVKGLKTYKSVLNSSVTLPEIEAKYITIIGNEK